MSRVGRVGTPMGDRWTQSPDCPRMAAFHERRARYAQLREGGLDPFAAVAQLGLHETAAARYERWYQER